MRRKGRRGWTKFENGEDGDIGGIFIKLGGDLDPSANYAITRNDFMRVKSKILNKFSRIFLAFNSYILNAIRELLCCKR